MGFHDRKKNIKALVEGKGNILDSVVILTTTTTSSN